MRKVIGFVAAFGFIVTQASVSHAVVVAAWTFETSPPADLNNTATIGPLSADVGTGSATGSHAATGTDWSTPLGNGSANSLNSSNWAIGDYYQFSFSTTGLSNVVLSWDQARSGTGPAIFDLTYSVNGGSFLTLLDNYAVVQSGGEGSPATWSATPPANSLYSFTVPAGVLNNVSSVVVRLVADSAAGGSSGTGRVDNFVVTAVPEASSFLFGGLALCAVGVPALRRGWRVGKSG